MLGERINSVHVLPKRLVDRGHPEDGAWGRWARFVLRRPRLIAFAGIVIVAALAGLGTQLNPHEPQLRNIPGSGTAIAGRQMPRTPAPPGVMKPLDVLVERGGSADAIASQLRTVPGIAASLPPTWRHGPDSLLEAFPAADGSAPGAAATIDRVKVALAGGDGTLTGVAAVDQGFLHTLYANFPYLLAFVLVLTLLLLARAFRSIVLALKAVLLNLVSLAAAFGIVVFVFQQGHGSAIWSIGATQSITPWLPLMIFAFLYGLSMDYEVFMLTRIREAYDQTGSTHKAIELGLARTGKLVTSAALILMFAFLLLSTSPGYESKEFAIALAAGSSSTPPSSAPCWSPRSCDYSATPTGGCRAGHTRSSSSADRPAGQGCTQNSPAEKPHQSQTAAKTFAGCDPLRTGPAGFRVRRTRALCEVRKSRLPSHKKGVLGMINKLGRRSTSRAGRDPACASPVDDQNHLVSTPDCSSTTRADSLTTVPQPERFEENGIRSPNEGNAVTALGFDRFAAELRAEADAFASAVDGADLALRVPTCPEWTLEQLVHHVGRAYYWATAIITSATTTFIPFESVPEAVLPEQPGKHGDWLRDGAEHLGLRGSGDRGGIDGVDMGTGPPGGLLASPARRTRLWYTGPTRRSPWPGRTNWRQTSPRTASASPWSCWPRA